MTREQVETEMAQYRTIFTVVRLLDAAQVGGEESINSFCSCYSYWGKNTPCRNCISRQVLEDHRQRTKLEYMGSEVFQVTAVYREVDGVPCVMELIQKLDGETLIDPENGERLIDSIASYHTKLYHDALTDSYNRLYFEDALKDKTDPAGVAVLDLDDFKLINDTYGHQAGDIALRTCVDVARACIRKSDVLIRYGGDEFLLVLPGIERAAFLAKLDRIREQLHTASVPGYSRLQLSASIGGVITQPGETVEQAVSRADKLMYQAKLQKNTVVTDHDCNVQPESTLHPRRSQQQILIVDDSEMNRAILAEMLHDEYCIIEASSGRECMNELARHGTDILLVLLDIVMPDMNGFEVLSQMAHQNWIEDIPVIMISSEDSNAIVRRAYELGASDYISRPFDAHIVYRRVTNTIRLYAKQRRLSTMVAQQFYEREKNNRMMINILSQVVEQRNGESGLHVRHVQVLTDILLDRLTQKTDRYQVSRAERSLISTAAALHDIGKITIDDKILNKPGRLTKEEFDIMKTHTLIGAEMLDNLDLKRRSNGGALADKLTYQTSEPDIFVGGDVYTGPRFAIDAIAAGREGAISLHRYVHENCTLTIGRNRRDFVELDKNNISVESYDTSKRQIPAKADEKAQAATFRDLSHSLTEEQVKAETSRCLSCGASVVDPNKCIGCGVCTTKCVFDAIHLHREIPGASVMRASEDKLKYILPNMVKQSIKVKFAKKK